MSVTINGVVLGLPDEATGAKTPQLNAAIIALAAQTETAWASWVPTWTNLTLGNGVVVAKYAKVGRLVFFRLSLVFGSTTSIGGSVSFALPATRAANAGTAGLTWQGGARFLDSSSGNKMEGVAINLTTTTAGLNVLDSSGTYLNEVNLSSTVPFAWATSDEITVQGFYEAAA